MMRMMAVQYLPKSSAGVVSRVELQTYAHGASHLLAIQIDAAISVHGKLLFNQAGFMSLFLSDPKQYEETALFAYI
jgi:hypothetical protein